MAEEFVAPQQPVVMTRQSTFGSFYLSDWPLTNPDPILRKLGKAITIYDDLSVDPRVDASLSQRLYKNKKLSWDLNKGKSKSREMKIAKRMIDHIGVYDMMDEIYEAAKYGLKVFEVVWTKSMDGFLWPTVFGLPPEWFFFNYKGELRWNKWNSYPKGAEIPAGQYILVRRNGSYKQPYGEAILARVFWWVTFKRDLVRYWNSHTMKYGTDALYAQHSFGADSQEAKMVEEGLKNIIAQRIAQFPDGVTLNSLQTASRDGAELYKKAIDYCDKMISEAILTQALTQDTGQGGSYAKLQVGQENEYNVTDADIYSLYEPFFNELIRLIYKMNFSTSVERPKFQMFDESWIAKDRLDRDVILKEKFGIEFNKEYFIREQNLHDEDFTTQEERDAIEDREEAAAMVNPIKSNEKAIVSANNTTQSQQKEKQEEPIEEPEQETRFDKSTYAFWIEAA